MIHVISPLGEAGIRTKYNLRLLAYSASLVGSSGITQLMIALLGAGLIRPVAPYLLPVVAITSAAYGLHELGFIRLPLPYRNWQVPRPWLRLGFYSSAIIYGLVLGTGFATRAPFSSFQVMSAVNAVVGVPSMAFALGAVYGLFRAGSLIGFSLVTQRASTEATLSLSRWVGGHAGYFHVLNGSILILFGFVWASLFYAAWTR
jgi:hypothetical protein